jgi:hypothetical protein
VIHRFSGPSRYLPHANSMTTDRSLVTVWDIAEPDLLSAALYQSGQTIL